MDADAGESIEQLPRRCGLACERVLAVDHGDAALEIPAALDLQMFLERGQLPQETAARTDGGRLEVRNVPEDGVTLPSRSWIHGVVGKSIGRYRIAGSGRRAAEPTV